MMYEVKDVQFLISSLVLVTDNFQLVTFNKFVHSFQPLAFL